MLIVEDDATVRELLELTLAGEGRRLLSAADGPAALDAVQDEQVDVIVCDVILPSMTGPEVVAELRRRSPSMRVLYISGAYDQAHFPSLGDGILLVKPFALQGLRDTVASLLADRRAPS